MDKQIQKLGKISPVSHYLVAPKDGVLTTHAPTEWVYQVRMKVYSDLIQRLDGINLFTIKKRKRTRDGIIEQNFSIDLINDFISYKTHTVFLSIVSNAYGLGNALKHYRELLKDKFIFESNSHCIVSLLTGEFYNEETQEAWSAVELYDELNSSKLLTELAEIKDFLIQATYNCSLGQLIVARQSDAFKIESPVLWKYPSAYLTHGFNLAGLEGRDQVYISKLPTYPVAVNGQVHTQHKIFHSSLGDSVLKAHYKPSYSTKPTWSRFNSLEYRNSREGTYFNALDGCKSINATETAIDTHFLCTGLRLKPVTLEENNKLAGIDARFYVESLNAQTVWKQVGILGFKKPIKGKIPCLVFEAKFHVGNLDLLSRKCKAGNAQAIVEFSQAMTQISHLGLNLEKIHTLVSWGVPCNSSAKFTAAKTTKGKQSGFQFIHRNYAYRWIEIFKFDSLIECGEFIAKK